jgi:hypothetical protein
MIHGLINKRHTRRYLAATIIGLLMGACIPYSVNSLTDPDKEKMDSFLCGSWYWRDENEAGFVHIGLEENSGLLHVIMLDRDAVIEAIEGAALKGIIAEGKWFSSVHITEGQKALQQFMLAHDKKLFKEAKVLHKLNLPEKRFHFD